MAVKIKIIVLFTVFVFLNTASIFRALAWEGGPTGWCTDADGNNFRCDEGGGSSDYGGGGWGGGGAETSRPDPAIQAYNRGIALDEAGRIDEAIAAYQEALRLNPNDSQVMNNLGVDYQIKKMYDEALRYYQQAVQADPRNKKHQDNLKKLSDWFNEKNATEYYNSEIQRGNDARDAQDYETAIEAYRNCIAKMPNEPMGYYNLSLVLSSAGKREESLEAARQAYKLKPQNDEYKENFIFIINWLALDNSMSKDKDVLLKTENLLREALKLDSNNQESKERLVANLRAQVVYGATNHDLNFSEKVCNKLIEFDPKNTQSLTLMGDIFIDKKDYRRAASWFDKAAALEPSNYMIYGQFGNNLKNAGAYREAAEAYQKSLRLIPEDNKDEIFATNLLMGISYYKSGDSVRGQKALDKAEELAGDNALTLRKIATNLYDEQCLDHAAAILQKAKQLYESGTDTSQLTGEELQEEKIYVNDAICWIKLTKAWQQVEKGDIETARKLFEETKQLNPSAEGVKKNLAKLADKIAVSVSQAPEPVSQPQEVSSSSGGKGWPSTVQLEQVEEHSRLAAQLKNEPASGEAKKGFDTPPEVKKEGLPLLDLRGVPLESRDPEVPPELRTETISKLEEKRSEVRQKRLDLEKKLEELEKAEAKDVVKIAETKQEISNAKNTEITYNFFITEELRKARPVKKEDQEQKDKK